MNLHIFLQYGITYRLTKLSIFLFLCIPVAIIVNIILKRKLRQNNKKLSRIQLQHQNELLRARVETQEQTFRNMSADIHDNIGQQLSNAAFITDGLSDQEPRRDELASIIRKGIRDMRDLSHSLSAKVIADEGLASAIKREFDLLNKGNRIRAQFFQLAEPAELDTETATLLYRVFQEAIQNVMKHAKASIVRAFLCKENDELHMTITDDGTGFSPDAVEGLGLTNMRARLKLINGSLEIENTPGCTTLLIKIPLKNEKV